MEDEGVYDLLCELAEEAYIVADLRGWHSDDISCEQRIVSIIEELGELAKVGRGGSGNSVEPKLAAVVLRCFDFIASQGGDFLFENGFEYSYRDRRSAIGGMDIPNLVLLVVRNIAFHHSYTLTKSLSASRAIGAIAAWCAANDIDLLYHIKDAIECGKEGQGVQVDDCR